MENYIDSLAGYCVITYLLGIGDRHKENIMITNKGQFFHIDFGYIMDNDPKWGAPPFKLSTELVQAMGGTQTQNYQRFITKSIDIFKYIRSDYKLFLNLFLLMIDSWNE